MLKSGLKIGRRMRKKCFKKWLVATVACAVDPKIVNHQILVLVGAQGLGKTTWLHKLLPPALKGYMYSGNINPNNKDTLTTLTENILINLDELGDFRRHNLDSLKELITKPIVQVRRAYAIYAENYTRRASFMGSVNHFHFLSDDTGNRRFLPFTVTAINYKHDINLDNVYAQAYALFKEDKFQYWFDKEEVREIEEYLEQYKEKSPEQELLEQYFDIPKVGERGSALTATQVVEWFQSFTALRLNNATVQKMGSLLRQLGCIRVKRDGVYKYMVRLKVPRNIETKLENE